MFHGLLQVNYITNASGGGGGGVILGLEFEIHILFEVSPALEPLLSTEDVHLLSCL